MFTWPVSPWPWSYRRASDHLCWESSLTIIMTVPDKEVGTQQLLFVQDYDLFILGLSLQIRIDDLRPSFQSDLLDYIYMYQYAPKLHYTTLSCPDKQCLECFVMKTSRESFINAQINLSSCNWNFPAKALLKYHRHALSGPSQLKPLSLPLSTPKLIYFKQKAISLPTYLLFFFFCTLYALLMLELLFFCSLC